MFINKTPTAKMIMFVQPSTPEPKILVRNWLTIHIRSGNNKL